MQLFFIDDSGTISPKTKIFQKHFVLGGLVIPEDQWHNLERDFSYVCKNFKVTGEIKWRFFGQKIGREDEDNSLSHLTIEERDELRRSLLLKITKYQSIKIIVSVVHLPTIYSLPMVNLPEEVYSFTYKPLTERFQYYLQDLSRSVGSKINGIIISDQRNPAQDRNLRNFHFKLLKSNSILESKYENLIETLFLAPSHHSIGIQFADLISGAIFRYFEHGDDRWFRLIEPNFRKGVKGNIEGYGLVRIPKNGWKEMTLSQENLSNLR